MSSPLKDTRLIEPPSAEDLIPDTSWESWALIGGGALILILCLAYIWWSRQRSKSQDSDDSIARAHAQALAALATCHDEDATKLATQASLILRRYLAVVSGDPALYETHEELVARHDAFKDLKEGTAQQLKDAFSELARIKYAPARAEENPSEIHEQARQLLESLNREFSS